MNKDDCPEWPRCGCGGQPCKRSRYVYGFDPARGEDHSVEVVFERMPDGKLRLVDRGEVIEGTLEPEHQDRDQPSNVK